MIICFTFELLTVIDTQITFDSVRASWFTGMDCGGASTIGGAPGRRIWRRLQAVASKVLSVWRINVVWLD